MLSAIDRVQSVNPSTEAVVAEYPIHTEADVDAILDAVERRWPAWRRTPVEERCRLVRSIGGRLRARADELATLISREMGKTIRESRAEVEKCAFTCEWYSENAPRMLADEPMPSDSARSFVAYEPLGVVLAGMPWNFPFWQVFRFAAPALCAGNSAVLKHASNVTGCAFAIEDVIRDAGVPGDVFRTLVIPNHRVAAVVADPRVAAVTLTGSTAAGRSVGRAAGEVVKHSVLELGGSDAFVVLEDADVAAAAAMAAASRFQNAGQSCIAAKRFIVVEQVADEFEDRRGIL